MTTPTVDQIADAIQYDVTRYWNGIELPTPQKTGSLTQQRTYAVVEARKFIKNLPSLIRNTK